MSIVQNAIIADIDIVKIGGGRMSNNKQSSVEYLMDKLFDPSSMVEEQLEWFEQAKAMHNKEHGNTWDASMNNFKVRGMNIVRAWEDFDEYYNETYGGNK